MHPINQKSYLFQVFLYLSLILLITILSIIILDQKYLDKQIVSDFHHELEIAAKHLEFEIEMNREHLKSQSSRTMIRNELYKWYKGEVGFDNLKSYSENKYIDGICVYDNIRNAVRYDLSGRIVSSFRNEDQPALPDLDCECPRISFYNSEYQLSLKNEIVQNGTLIGYDMATFSLSSINTGFTYVDNVRIIPQASLFETSYTGSFQIGSMDFFVVADLNPDITTERRIKHLSEILRWILILVLVISLVSYFTIFQLTNNLISELEESGRKNLQQERFAAIGQMGAGLAHDFNNILNVILGYVELMQTDESAEPGLISKLNIVHSNTLRASHLIKQLMDYSSIGFLRQEKIILKQFMTGLFSGSHDHRGVELSFDLAISDNLEITMDRIQFKTIFMNLMANAREAGSQNVRIACSELDESVTNYCSLCDTHFSGKWIFISFMNDGQLIAPEISNESLFEPFFSTKGPQHPGLGLSQTYGIIRQHKGHIGVKRDNERGLEFQIYLPMDE